MCDACEAILECMNASLAHRMVEAPNYARPLISQPWRNAPLSGSTRRVFDIV